MKEFFLILFFAKSILLTPDPVDFRDRIELTPGEPIEAITSGAGIEIDVSSMVSRGPDDDFLVLREKILERFPPGTIRGTLVGSEAPDVVLSYQGHSSIGEDEVVLLLNADESGIPTGVPYSKVIIVSDIELQGISIVWKNHRL